MATEWDAPLKRTLDEAMHHVRQVQIDSGGGMSGARCDEMYRSFILGWVDAVVAEEKRKDREAFIAALTDERVVHIAADVFHLEFNTENEQTAEPERECIGQCDHVTRQAIGRAIELAQHLLTAGTVER